MNTMLAKSSIMRSHDDIQSQNVLRSTTLTYFCVTHRRINVPSVYIGVKLGMTGDDVFVLRSVEGFLACALTAAAL